MKDHVDEDGAVVCLEQPPFGWPLDPETDAGERSGCALRVLRADVEVDVVVGRRSTTRPRGEPSSQHELDLRIT